MSNINGSSSDKILDFFTQTLGVDKQRKTSEKKALLFFGLIILIVILFVNFITRPTVTVIKNVPDNDECLSLENDVNSIPIGNYVFNTRTSYTYKNFKLISVICSNIKTKYVGGNVTTIDEYSPTILRGSLSDVIAIKINFNGLGCNIFGSFSKLNVTGYYWRNLITGEFKIMSNETYYSELLFDLDYGDSKTLKIIEKSVENCGHCKWICDIKEFNFFDYLSSSLFLTSMLLSILAFFKDIFQSK